jgi:hypothetical protein
MENITEALCVDGRIILMGLKELGAPMETLINRQRWGKKPEKVLTI